MEYITKDSRFNDERHLVVYIESHDKVPHSVITVEWDKERGCWDKWANYWDFEKNGHEDSLIFYNSGCGGSIKEIQAPHYVDGATGCTVWLHQMASFKEGSHPINCTVVSRPPMYKSWHGRFANPFKHGEEQSTIEYCAVCDCYYGNYGCDEHTEYCND